MSGTRQQISSPTVRFTTVVSVVIVALVAAVVSYSHMQEVAFRAGEQWRSWLVPLSVDGLVVAASMVLLRRRRAGLPGGWLPWTALLAGVGVSLAANIAAAEPTITARLVAAWPAMAFAVAFELLLRQRRADPATIEQADRETVPAQPADPATQQPASQPTEQKHSAPTRKRASKTRTDAQLSKAVRELAERNGGIPPTRYQLRQTLGVGNDRAARLLAELSGVTPVGPPASNGAATSGDNR